MMGMAEWLDNLTLDQRVRVHNTFRSVIKCKERVCQLSVIPGKKAKGITRTLHQFRPSEIEKILTLPFGKLRIPTLVVKSLFSTAGVIMTPPSFMTVVKATVW